MINWNADDDNPHGILVEISDMNDTTLSFGDLGDRRAYYYFPQDDGQIEISPTLIKTFQVKSGDVKRFRIYRGNFDQLETEVDYPKKIKFMYWSSVYKKV